MSRFNRCNCPAGFGAGAERHAPDCPGRKLDAITPTPLTLPRITPADFGASRPQINLPEGFDPGYSAQRAALQELLQKNRRENEALQDELLLRALGVTREEAVANRHRITRHCHPDRDLFLLDGEPVVEIHKPVIRGDELVTSYKILRTLP